MIKKLEDLNTILKFIVDVYNETICKEDSLAGRYSFINNYVYGNETYSSFYSNKEEYFGYYDNELLGVISLSNDGYIKFLFVKAKKHGLGIGRKLLEHVIGIAKKYKIKRLFLDSSISNVEFYLKMNFIQISEPICKDNIWFIPMERNI